MPYFSRMSVTFFKNGLKWLGYMYIKGFWAELASYRNLKSNRVSGKCGPYDDLMMKTMLVIILTIMVITTGCFALETNDVMEIGNGVGSSLAKYTD